MVNKGLIGGILRKNDGCFEALHVCMCALATFFPRYIICLVCEWTEGHGFTDTVLNRGICICFTKFVLLGDICLF